MKPTLRNLAVGGVVLLALAAVYLARHVLVPFLLAAVIAYTLNPLVAALERRGVRRGWGALLVMCALLLALVGAAAAIVPEMIVQVRQFADRLPGYSQSVQEKIQPLTAWLQDRYPDQIESLKAQAAAVARGVLPALAGWAAAALKGAVTSVARIVVWLLTIVVVPVFTYYLLADYREIHVTLESLIPEHIRPAVQRRVEEIDRVLRAWLKGQLTVASVLAVIYAVGLTLLGVPLGLLIGVIGGLSHIVPYMGLVTGFIPAATLAFLETGRWSSALMVAAVFLLGQILEATVISPRIVGSGLGLPPALVLLAVFVGGELFGFTGLLLAVPVTAASLVLLRGLRRTFDAPEPERGLEAARLAVRRPRPRP